MDRQSRKKALQSIMWDYSIAPEEIEMLIDGKIDRAGHYTLNMLFAKVLMELPWFTIISIMPVGQVKDLLTDEVIEMLWPKSVQNKYKYVRKRLQETLQTTR